MTAVQGTVVEHRLDAEGVDPLLLAGVNDANIQEVAGLFGIRLVLRGDDVILSGDPEAIERATPLVQHLLELSRLRVPFQTNDIARFAEGLATGGVVHSESDVEIGPFEGWEVIRSRRYGKAVVTILRPENANMS